MSECLICRALGVRRLPAVHVPRGKNPSRGSAPAEPRPATSAPAEPRPATSVAATSGALPAAPAPRPPLHRSFTLTNDRGHGLVLASDGGGIEAAGRQSRWERSARTGSFALASGRPGPKLEADGRIVAPNGQKLPVRIAEDGAVEVENTGPAGAVRFDDAGRLVGGNPHAPKTRSRRSDSRAPPNGRLPPDLAAFPDAAMIF